MAKPLFPPPEWASAETNNTEPSSGQKATGWTTNQKGVSSYDNWYKRSVQAWLEYLDSNAVDGNLEVDGNLHVTGSADIDTDLNVDGSAVVDGSLLVSGNLYHGERTVAQNYEGAVGSYSVGGASQPATNIGAGVSILVPIKAPLISGVSRVKRFTIVAENVSAPSVTYIEIINPLVTTELLTGLGITRDGGVVWGTGHTKWTFTINGGGTVLAANRQAMFKVTNNGGGAVNFFGVEVIYDAPKP